MRKHRSFLPSDFTWRDIPVFVLGYLVIAALSVGLGLALESLPAFWRGLLGGLGLGALGTSAVLLRILRVPPRQADESRQEGGESSENNPKKESNHEDS